MKSDQLNIDSFIQPARTFLPCSGVGRHVNNLIMALERQPDVNLKLLFSRQWLTTEGKLPKNAPLRYLPFNTFPWQERLAERSWKAINWPKMDSYLDGDWMFSPVDTRFPAKQKKTAITIHDLQAFETDLPWSNTVEHRKFKKRWGLWVEKAAHDADLVFTVSEFSRQRLIKLLKIDKTKVKVSGNALDPVFLRDLSKTPTKKTNYPYIAVIGGLRPKKGGHEILKLADKLKKEWPEMKLVIWGENDKQLVNQAKQIGNVISLDMITDLEMISWLKGSYASVFLSWYEGFGIPVLEAMACGTPVICSNKASLPEVAGNAAFLVNPDDTNVIAFYLNELKNQHKRDLMIQKGFKNIKRYSWDVCANNVIKALKYES